MLSFDPAAATVYASIRAHLQASGQLIGPNDLIIAATAVAHHALLVSANVREFRRVPGLRVEDWTQ
jgi:tRNA(fMet)-specific endonuclease VapC